MNYEELNKELKAGTLQRVYLLHGPENFVKERSLKRICSLALEDGLAELNLTKFEETATPQEIVDACETLPVFAPRRVVVYYDCPILMPAGKSTGEDLLADYLARVPEHAVLIFFMRAKADGRRSLYKKLAKHCTVQFDALSPAAMYTWLQQDAKMRGISVRQGTLERLVEYVGNDMWTVVHESEKVYAYAYPRTQITDADVDAICTRTAEADAFDMLASLLKGRKEEAAAKLVTALQKGASVQSIMGALGYTLRSMHAARVYLDRGISPQKAAEQMEGNRFANRQAVNNASGYSKKQIERAIKGLAEADHAIKSGRMGERAALDSVLFGLLGK